MKILNEQNNSLYSLKTSLIELDSIPNINSKLSRDILKTLAKQSMYPKEIAKHLKVHEQNVYYCIKKLISGGFIKVEKEKFINGTYANYYTLTSPSFSFSFKEFEKTPKLSVNESDFLKPFIKEGKLDSLIIVGSPDPHGPLKARSRDGYFGMDLALFLGSFLTSIPESKVRLDTETTINTIKENNLIIIGGPIVNKITSSINQYLPIYYDEEKKGIYSTISKKIYFDEACGMITKIKNPYNEEKSILLIAGLRNAGTKAAIIAFLKHFEKIKQGNSFNKKYFCNVVEGLDIDSDGLVDDCEFLE